MAFSDKCVDSKWDSKTDFNSRHNRPATLYFQGVPICHHPEMFSYGRFTWGENDDSDELDDDDNDVPLSI